MSHRLFRFTRVIEEHRGVWAENEAEARKHLADDLYSPRAANNQRPASDWRLVAVEGADAP